MPINLDWPDTLVDAPARRSDADAVFPPDSLLVEDVSTSPTGLPVDGLEPVGTDSSATDRQPRYEIKFTVPCGESVRLGGWLRLHPAGFSVLYPARQVNSVYFDTPDLTCLQQNLAGLASRSKLRLRWYGRDLARVEGTLELKHKRGLLGFKPCCKVPVILNLRRQRWSEVVHLLDRHIPAEWRHYLRIACLPIILTSYQREYYISADRLVRLTVDRAQKAYDQRRSVRPNLRWPTPVPERIIVELKGAAEQRDRLADIASVFPARITRCSKYVDGVQAILTC